MRRASDETRLTVPRPSPRCPLIFLGWCLGFFFLFAFYDHYRLPTATVWIIEHRHCFHNFLCLPDPSPPPFRPFTNSSLSSFVWNSSSLHPETRHSFHQGVFCHKINRNLGEIDTEAGSSATVWLALHHHGGHSQQQRSLETRCLSSSRYRCPDHLASFIVVVGLGDSWEPTSCWAILVNSP